MEPKDQAQQPENDNNNTPVADNSAIATLMSRLDEQAAVIKQLNDRNQAQETELEAIRRSKDDADLAAAADLKALLQQESTNVSSKDDDPLNNLSNQQMLDIMANALEKSVEARIKQFGNSLAESAKPQAEQMNQLTQAIGAVMAKLDVQSASSKYEDFNKFGPDVTEVLKNHPSMSIEDAYIFAKAKKSGTTPPQNVVDTERPMNIASMSGQSPGSAGADDRIGRANSVGQQGGSLQFRELVKQAAEELIASGKE